MERDQLKKLANLHPLRKLGKIADITSWVLHLAGEYCIWPVKAVVLLLGKHF